VAYWDFKHLKLANHLFPNVFTPKIIEILVDYCPQAKLTHAVLLTAFPLVIIGFVYGLFVRDLRKEATEALGHLGLKTAQDKVPQVVRVIELDEFRKKILVSSVGLGVDRYVQRKSDLEMSLRSTIESIKTTTNNKYIEICTTDRTIPMMLSYRNCLASLDEPLTFPIGESLGGLLTQSLSSLPHMMIAGASGGGKSNFFKQTIVSLIKTTPRLQVYLLDLKQGVETMEFEGLPNVSVAKTEAEASILLAKLKDEMSQRFDIIKKAGRTSIDPERDRRDIIVIAVDEASVLYGKTRVSKSRAKNATQARELTDDLAKLGRAAKMHLILATQKVTTETIDTKIQENMGGRICFRANTLQGSMTVLGNKMAYELPDVKGRAIWGNGTTFVELQTPFISDKVLTDEIKQLTTEYKDGKRKSFNNPYTVQAVVEEDEQKKPEKN
jgi:S-DNA-T family DNA segregation ATPase FtsK/SpoIIIE